MAIPWRNKSLEDVRKDLFENLPRIGGLEDDKKSFTIYEVTQLVDKDMCECFLVSVDMTNGIDLNVVEKQLDAEAEAWVTSCGPLPLAPPYGWNLDTFVCDRPDDSTRICQLLQEYGLVVVRGHYNNGIYQETLALFQKHKETMEDIVRDRHPHIDLGKSAFGFREYTHRGQGRFEVLFDESSELYTMLKEFFEPQWIDSVCSFLSCGRSKVRLAISCVYSRPSSPDQDWHTDGVQFSDGQPYAVCIFEPLIPFTSETGYTRFLAVFPQIPALAGIGSSRRRLACHLGRSWFDVW